MTFLCAIIVSNFSPPSSGFFTPSPISPNCKMREAWLILSNVALPICAGISFFALAKYVTHIAPMRQLVTGELTYKGAVWGFAFFGAYLISRPLQVLLGPYPMPLVINQVREF